MKRLLGFIAALLLCAAPLAAQTRLNFYSRTYAGWPSVAVGDIPYVSSASGGGIFAAFHAGASAGFFRWTGTAWEIDTTGYLKTSGANSMGGTLHMANNDIDGIRNLGAGQFFVDSQQNITTPPADQIGHTAKKIAGQVHPAWKDEGGLVRLLQPSMFSVANFVMCLPGRGGNGTQIGSCPNLQTGAATNAAAAPATTAPARYSSLRRADFGNSVAETYRTVGYGYESTVPPMLWRGNAAGLGGFFYHARFGPTTWTAGDCLFAGIQYYTSAGTTGSLCATDGVISTKSTAPMVGIGVEVGDAVFKLYTGNGTAVTKTALTTTPPTISAGANTIILDLWLYAPPNGSTIYYRVDDVVNDVTLADSDMVTAGLSLPGNTVFFSPVAYGSQAGNASINAMVMGVHRMIAYTPDLGKAAE